MVGLLACVIVESFEKVATASSNSRIVIKINFGLSFEQIHSVSSPNGNDLKPEVRPITSKGLVFRGYGLRFRV